VIERQYIDPLDTAAARSFVAQLDASEKEFWFLWRDGYPDWVKVSDPHDLAEFQNASPPSVMASSAIARAIAGLMKDPGKDRRKHERLALRLKVVILTEDKKTFRSFTKDVSLGGLLLENPLPWPVPEQACEVFIAAPGEVEAIQFRAKILSDLKNPLRIEFQDCDKVFLEKLNQWIAAVAQKSLKAA